MSVTEQQKAPCEKQFRNNNLPAAAGVSGSKCFNERVNDKQTQCVLHGTFPTNKKGYRHPDNIIIISDVTILLAITRYSEIWPSFYTVHSVELHVISGDLREVLHA